MTDPQGYRQATGLNQSAFWAPLGVTQSGGSRYESTGRTIPTPVALLLVLRDQGVITDEILAEAQRTVEASRA
ncbi:helix-turn-helix domain-containing protein [Uliginosibacterium gangwonense]|uniref:helix-turn-helix domain-containing protein n=1 Tax=Uliginosibacterium gangwonense TaxID=392736 RepID=UPI003CCBEB8F